MTSNRRNISLISWGGGGEGGEKYYYYQPPQYRFCILYIVPIWIWIDDLYHLFGGQRLYLYFYSANQEW